MQRAESELRLSAVGGLRKPPSGAEAGAEGAQAGGGPGECGLSRGKIRARGQHRRSRDVCRDDEGTVGCGRNVTGVVQVLNSCGREQEDPGGHLGGVGLREPGRRGEKSGRPSLPQPDPATEGTSRFFKPTLHSGDRNVASCSFPGWRWKTLVTFRRARRFLPAPFPLTECEGLDRGWAPGPDPARRERRTGRGPRPPVLAEMERHRCHAGREATPRGPGPEHGAARTLCERAPLLARRRGLPAAKPGRPRTLRPHQCPWPLPCQPGAFTPASLPPSPRSPSS